MTIAVSTRFDTCRKCYSPVTLRMQPEHDEASGVPPLHFSIWYCPHCHAPNTGPGGSAIEAVPGHQFDAQRAG